MELLRFDGFFREVDEKVRYREEECGMEWL